MAVDIKKEGDGAGKVGLKMFNFNIFILIVGNSRDRVLLKTSMLA